MMNNDRQVGQGRMVRNPYAQMVDESGYPHCDYPESRSSIYSVQVPATYEMNDRVPVGRPIQPVQPTPLSY